MANDQGSHIFVHPHDQAMFGYAPHYINNGILLDLAHRYTAAQIAERVNAAQQAQVVTTASIRKRLYRSIARVAEREQQSAKDVKAEIDAARSASQAKVGRRSNPDARRDDSVMSSHQEEQEVQGHGAIVTMAKKKYQVSANHDHVDALLMAVDDIEEDDPINLDEEADDGGLMAPASSSGIGAKSAGDTGKPDAMNFDDDDDSSELSEPPSDLDEPSDTDTVIDEEAEAEVREYKFLELNDKFATREVHGFFAETHSRVDDDDIVQLSRLYTIEEIVDYLNETGAKRHGMRYTAKDVRQRISEAVGGLAERRGLSVKTLCMQLDQERIASGVTARTRAEVTEKRRTRRK